LVQGVAGVPNTAEDDDRFGSSLASGDFNGDGYGDLGIAAVREDWGSVIDAGAVVVLLGSVDGLTADGSQIWVDSAYEEGDRYGVGLAAGDLDGNGYDELVVGIPGKEVGAVADGGALEILHGGPNGLYRPAAADVWHQDSTDVLDIAESSDGFGATLAIGDFDDDAFPDLAVGVIGEDVAGISNAGAVQILYGSEAGVTAAGNQLWHQDSPGVDGSAEQDDRFGGVLEAVPRGRRVFADGFESGDTWWWSVTVN
jgi:hypothetical protein